MSMTVKPASLLVQITGKYCNPEQVEPSLFVSITKNEGSFGMTKLSLTAEWKELYLSTDTAKMQFVANREVLKCFHHVANWCRPTNDTDLSMKLQKTLSDLDSLIY